MQMTFHRKLPIPQEVKEEFPLTEHMKQVKAARDEAINAVFDGIRTFHLNKVNIILSITQKKY